METTKKKLGFFDQVINSVLPSKYKELADLPKHCIIKYCLLLFLCLAIMNFVVPVAGFFISVGGYDHFVTETLPDIELKDGALTVENRIETGKNSLTHILVDTDVERVTVDQIGTDKYLAEILIAKENMIVYSDGVNTMEIDYDQLGDIVLNNEGLLELKTVVYFILIVSFFTSLFSVAVQYLFSAAFLALLCWGPFRVRGSIETKYTRILTFAIYAKTVPELLIAFNGSAGLITNQFILAYVPIAAAMLLLLNGLRRATEEKKA